MTLPGNGTLKRIVACVVGGVILFMAGAVLANRTDISAICVQVDNNKDSIKLMREQFEKRGDEILKIIDGNRRAAVEDYKEIRALLTEISREVKK